MTSSSYTSKKRFLLRALRDAWRPKKFRNLTLGDCLAAVVVQPEVLLTSEALATAWLAGKPDLETMKRDDYKGQCIDLFGISGRAYQFLVLPVARKLAGLTMCAKSGPKKQIKK
jgi:hypothetical protein